MKKLILFISLAAILAACGGLLFWRQASAGMGEPIVSTGNDVPDEESGLVNRYVPFTEGQIKEIEKRVMSNIARTSKGGKPLNEAEMREVANYMIAVVKNYVNIRIDHFYVVEDLQQYFPGAQAVCVPAYDEAAGIAHEPIYVDMQAYENAKTDAAAMIRLLYLMVHETSHGIQPDTTHNPLSLTGLVFNLWEDAKLVIPEHMNGEARSLIHEMRTDVLACAIILNDFVPKLDIKAIDDARAVGDGFDITTEAMYGSQLAERSQRLLMAVLPGMDGAMSTAPYNDVTIVAGVTDAYASAQITPNAAVAPYIVPSFGDFVKYMDETYGIGQIKDGFKEETIGGYSVGELKRFTLCAPLMLGMADVNYKSYGAYLADLAGQYADVKVLSDNERIWTPAWAVEMDNKAFGEILAEYLQ